MFLTLLFQAAVVVAFANIQIPLMLGEIVNVVSGFCDNEAVAANLQESAREFYQQIMGPATRLFQLYLVQVRIEFLLLDIYLIFI